MNEYIKVRHKEISGLKNPKFSVIGDFYKEDIDFEVKADGKVISCDYYQNIESFVLSALLTKDMKNITLYVKEDNKLCELFTIKNTFFKTNPSFFL